MSILLSKKFCRCLCLGFWTRHYNRAGIEMKAGTTMKQERNNRDSTTWGKCRDDGGLEEREEVDEISFCLGARLNSDVVGPPPPQPQMQP